MRAIAWAGLRARLAIALVGVAVLAVGLAMLLSNRGLEPLVTDAARSRLQRSADHLADLAAVVYVDKGGWSPTARRTLTHLAELDGLRFTVRTSDGDRFGRLTPGSETAEAAIVAGASGVGSIEVAGAGPGLLTPEEEHLRSSLNRLHLIAGAASVAAALLLAFLLAETLSKPLRRIRGAAERIEHGDLRARVEPTGDPELRSVAYSLNRLAGTLEQEEQIRRQTVGDLAHELRTPVNGLLARIEAAQDGLLDAPANLEAMHTEALRLTRLLDDLSMLADAERPGLLLEKEPLDLAEVARATADSFAPRFADAGITLEIVSSPAWVDGNRNRLEQIVSNLLSNALQYTEKGGIVTLRVEGGTAEAVLDVSDTGVGIAPEDFRHVFTRFWRSDRSRSRATGGAGIGLAIVQELVRAHNGRVAVDSKPAQGSHFRVVLPAIARPRSRLEPMTARDRAR